MPLAPDALNISLKRAFLALGMTLVLALAVAQLYRSTSEASGWTRWVAAGVVHSVLALAVVVLLKRRGEMDFLKVSGARTEAPAWLKHRTYLLFAPAAVVLLGAALIAAISRTASGDADLAGAPFADATTPLAWILWIPVVEEVVFRGGFSPALRRVAGPLWGAWFAAATFSLAHGNPSWASLVDLEVALPLGPFLLGLACEALVGLGGRLLPAIALHAACNATVAVFGAIDARWLDWLGFLYGHG